MESEDSNHVCWAHFEKGRKALSLVFVLRDHRVGINLTQNATTDKGPVQFGSGIDALDLLDLYHICKGPGA